jgi:predicted ATPase
LRFFCSPHHQDSALYPSIAQLERAAGLRREDMAEQRLEKLEAVLAQGTNDLSQVVPLLADLLAIPTGDRYPPLDLLSTKQFRWLRQMRGELYDLVDMECDEECDQMRSNQLDISSPQARFTTSARRAVSWPPSDRACQILR